MTDLNPTNTTRPHTTHHLYCGCPHTPETVWQIATTGDWSHRPDFVQGMIMRACNLLRAAIDAGDEKKARELTDWLIQEGGQR